MSFARACAFLVAASARNLVLLQARRLRRPRYLVPAVLGVGYFAMLFAQNARSAQVLRGSPLAAILAGAQPYGALLLAAIAALSWILGKPVPRLGFTEAEILFLFAAPVGRRALVHYRLVRLVLGSTLGALLLPLLAGPMTGGPLGVRAVALALIFATLNLHAAGASLVRAHLHARLSGWRLRAAQAGLLSGAAAVVAGAWSDVHALAAPAQALLWPARALVRPVFAAGVAELLPALPAAVLVLAAHYAFVLFAAVGFEDAAVAGAERRARALEQFRATGFAGVPAGGRRMRTPFRLAAQGRPELALAWKGLIGTSRSLQLRVLAVVVLAVLAAVVGLVAFDSRGADWRPLVGVGGFTVLALVALTGPVSTRSTGLAADLSRLDTLRALPLSGARVILGEALGPTFLLAGAWTVAVPAAALLGPFGLGGIDRGWLGLALLVAGPPLLLLGVALQALFTAVLPGWVALGSRNIGAQLLPMLVHVVGLPLAALPAAATATVVAWLGGPHLGWSIAPVAAVAGADVLAAMIALVVALAGRAFEHIDPSDV